MIGTKTIVASLAVVLIIVLLSLAFPNDRAVCMEDMACWNCTTMGNHICGPAVEGNR